MGAEGSTAGGADAPPSPSQYRHRHAQHAASVRARSEAGAVARQGSPRGRHGGVPPARTPAKMPSLPPDRGHRAAGGRQPPPGRHADRRPRAIPPPSSSSRGPAPQAHYHAASNARAYSTSSSHDSPRGHRNGSLSSAPGGIADRRAAVQQSLDQAWASWDRRNIVAERVASYLGFASCLHKAYRRWLMWLVIRRCRDEAQGGAQAAQRALANFTGRGVRQRYFSKLIRFVMLRRGDSHAREFAKQRGLMDAERDSARSRGSDRERAQQEEINLLRMQVAQLRGQAGREGTHITQHVMHVHQDGSPTRNRRAAPAPVAAPVEYAAPRAVQGDKRLLDDLDDVLTENRRLEERLAAVEAERDALRVDKARLHERAEHCARVETELRLAQVSLRDAELQGRDVQTLRSENERLREEQRSWRAKQEELYERLYKRPDQIPPAKPQGGGAAAAARAPSATDAAVEQIGLLGGMRYQGPSPGPAYPTPSQPSPAYVPPPPEAPWSPPAVAAASLRRHGAEPTGVMSAADMVRCVEAKGLGSPRHAYNRSRELHPP